MDSRDVVERLGEQGSLHLVEGKLDVKQRTLAGDGGGRARRR